MKEDIQEVNDRTKREIHYICNIHGTTNCRRTENTTGNTCEQFTIYESLWHWSNTVCGNRSQSSKSTLQNVRQKYDMKISKCKTMTVSFYGK